MSSKANLLFTLAIALIFAILTGWDVWAPHPAPTPLQGVDAVPRARHENLSTTAMQIPKVTFAKLGGGAVNLQDLQGKIVLLNFWASWCAPCAKEFPELIKLLDIMNGKAVLLAVSVDSEESDILRFLHERKMHDGKTLAHKNLIIAWDKERKISQSIFGVIKYPETIIISPSGRMARKIIGGDYEWLSEESVKSLQQFE